MHRIGIIGARPGRQRPRRRAARRRTPGRRRHRPVGTRPERGPPSCCPAYAVLDRRRWSERAEVLVLAVPDDAIAAVAEALGTRAGQYVVHLSGAHGLAVLRGSAGTPVALHPPMTFTGTALDLERLPAITFTATAPDAARPFVDELVKGLGAGVQWVAEEAPGGVPRRGWCTARTTWSRWSSRRPRCCASAGVADPAATLRPLMTAMLDNALRDGPGRADRADRPRRRRDGPRRISPCSTTTCGRRTSRWPGRPSTWRSAPGGWTRTPRTGFAWPWATRRPDERRGTVRLTQTKAELRAAERGTAAGGRDDDGRAARRPHGAAAGGPRAGRAGRQCRADDLREPAAVRAGGGLRPVPADARGRPGRGQGRGRGPGVQPVPRGAVPAGADGHRPPGPARRRAGGHVPPRPLRRRAHRGVEDAAPDRARTWRCSARRTTSS